MSAFVPAELSAFVPSGLRWAGGGQVVGRRRVGRRGNAFIYTLPPIFLRLKTHCNGGGEAVIPSGVLNRSAPYSRDITRVGPILDPPVNVQLLSRSSADVRTRPSFSVPTMVETAHRAGSLRGPPRICEICFYGGKGPFCSAGEVSEGIGSDTRLRSLDAPISAYWSPDTDLAMV